MPSRFCFKYLRIYLHTITLLVHYLDRVANWFCTNLSNDSLLTCSNVKMALKMTIERSLKQETLRNTKALHKYVQFLIKENDIPT